MFIREPEGSFILGTLRALDGQYTDTEVICHLSSKEGHQALLLVTEEALVALAWP